MDFTECFMIRETEKARLFEIKGNKTQIWVPRSVIVEQITNPIPPGMEGKIPGKPALLKVEPWFKKNKEAFDD